RSEQLEGESDRSLKEGILKCGVVAMERSFGSATGRATILSSQHHGSARASAPPLVHERYSTHVPAARLASFRFGRSCLFQRLASERLVGPTAPSDGDTPPKTPNR